MRAKTASFQIASSRSLARRQASAMLSMIEESRQQNVGCSDLVAD
jgi:hypothetical protein